ncbi:hypothetical protein SDC9_125639 [bioreactor metagenome]|uniref:Uncharacterized protein n=1 Tax=bioreactor metagenome TaxID=1076179 RepID=A0A645CP00_9ZZZZ
MKPLAIYPIVFLDGIMFKVRKNRFVAYGHLPLGFIAWFSRAVKKAIPIGIRPVKLHMPLESLPSVGLSCM